MNKAGWVRVRLVGLVMAALVTVLLLVGAGDVQAQEPVRIIFLHHSCGHNLIEEGGVRPALAARGYAFYDHGYNGDGLRLADGTWTGEHFSVPDDNTDPDGLAAIFAQPLHDPPDNTFSHLMAYDVILFKSCFPTSNIADDDQLAAYQSYYRTIRDRVDQFPNKLFIIVTQPPQVPGASNKREAARAREFTRWVQSDEYLGGRSNLLVFDFFDLLAGDDNFLRREYRYDNYDAHPNQVANQAIGPVFVDFIDEAVQRFAFGAAPLEEASAGAAEPAGEQAQPETVESAPEVNIAGTGGLIDDFEVSCEAWHGGGDDMGSTMHIIHDTAQAYEGSAALRVDYAVVQGGWVDFGNSFDPPQDWRGSEGLSLWVQATDPARTITLSVFAGNPDSPAPYETALQLPAESASGWQQVVVPWSAFGLASWASESDPAVLDTSQVVGVGFSIGGDADAEGSLWLDHIQLAGEADAGETVDTGTVDQADPAAQAPAEDTAEDAAPVEEVEQPPDEGPASGACPASFAVLPLGVIGLALAGRRRGPAG